MITATIIRTLTTILLCVFLIGCYSTKSSNHYRLQPTRSERILKSAVAISRGYTQAKLNAKKAERERQLKELKLLLEALRLQMDAQHVQK